MIRERKIIVVGNGGTGKSTLSAKLGSALNLPVWHLDQVGWEAGWKRVPEELFRERLDAILQNDEWIVDGWSYHSTMRERCEAAELIIFLNYPYARAVIGCLRRWFMYYFRQNPFDPPHTRRGSVLMLTLKAIRTVQTTYLPDLKHILSDQPAHKVMNFRSRSDVNRWLRSHGVM